MKIILAPFSTRLSSGSPNPKNPPPGFWQIVVSKLVALGHEVVQIGMVGEERVEGVSQHFTNWPLKALREVLKGADCFLTIDSFLPHFVWAEKLNKRGVVIWSQSDHLIWGHPENVNLLKDRKYLREFQYQSWPEATYNADAFVSPLEVISAVQNLLTGTEPTDRGFPIPPGFRLEK